jgi:hypothetical protein|tara:strand:+ start:464 stop:712 length:249 start_codon:yes stop_codon:yes gene_type:complete
LVPLLAVTSYLQGNVIGKDRPMASTISTHIATGGACIAAQAHLCFYGRMSSHLDSLREFTTIVADTVKLEKFLAEKLQPQPA